MANEIVKEYTIKGFAMYDERLKNEVPFLMGFLLKIFLHFRTFFNNFDLNLKCRNYEKQTKGKESIDGR